MTVHRLSRPVWGLDANLEQLQRLRHGNQYRNDITITIGLAQGL